MALRFKGKDSRGNTTPQRKRKPLKWKVTFVIRLGQFGGNGFGNNLYSPTNWTTGGNEPVSQHRANCLEAAMGLYPKISHIQPGAARHDQSLRVLPLTLRHSSPVYPAVAQLYCMHVFALTLKKVLQRCFCPVGSVEVSLCNLSVCSPSIPPPPAVNWTW